MKEENKLIYLVEDDEWFATLVKNRLDSYSNFEIKHFNKAQSLLEATQVQKPDIVIMDYHLDGHIEEGESDIKDGMALMEEMKRRGVEVPTILLSGQENIQLAVDLLKFNGIDYIVKNDAALDRLEKSIDKILEFKSIKQNINNLEGKVSRLQKGLMITAGILVCVLFLAFSFL